MPGDDYLSVPHASDNPRAIKKWGAEDIRAEIARVDAEIASLEAARYRFDGHGWRQLGQLSLPVAMHCLKHYRQRLARSAAGAGRARPGG